MRPASPTLWYWCQIIEDMNNGHHNYASEEMHHVRVAWVTRKRALSERVAKTAEVGPFWRGTIRTSYGDRLT